MDFRCVRRLRTPPQIILQVRQRRPAAFEPVKAPPKPELTLLFLLRFYYMGKSS